jgi:hypothetical protein
MKQLPKRRRDLLLRFRLRMARLDKEVPVMPRGKRPRTVGAPRITSSGHRTAQWVVPFTRETTPAQSQETGRRNRGKVFHNLTKGLKNPGKYRINPKHLE